jgi:glycosyltransferase involved in cell wall biosynthesis
VPRYSIITCVSKPEVYQSCVLDSINLTRRDHDIEIIPILNMKRLYSASSAFNIGIDIAKSNTLIFMHQDVAFKEGWFGRLESVLGEIPKDWAVLGSAGIGLQYGRKDIGRWGGAKGDEIVAVGTVYDHHDSPKPYWDGIKETTASHCVDECLFVLNKQTGLRFDNQFTGFHFYGVDICLQARAAAYSVYCSDLPIVHYGKYSSSFSEDDNYWHYLRLLRNKWRIQFPEVLATHAHWAHGLEEYSGADKIKDELVSYIPIRLKDNNGVAVGIKSFGIERIRFSDEVGFI